MRTFTVNEPSGASTTLTAETMELRGTVLVFLKAESPVAAFATWSTVVEEGVSTAVPAPAPLAEPAAVTELRESMRQRGEVV